MADWDIFELFPVQYGSESNPWTGVHVKVRMWFRPRGFENKDGMVCLTHEAENAEELDQYIDELISELQDLKNAGRRKFAALKRTEKALT
jgi:hypothetical protein